MTGQSGTKKPNTPQHNEQTAIRLRENQRRSRARKKEYIASLEERLRNCQKMGVEANQELQNAARKVLRENYRLRELLRIKNVDEDEIEAFLRMANEEIDGTYEVERSLEPRQCTGLDCCGGEPSGSGDAEVMQSSDMNVMPSTSMPLQPRPPVSHQQLEPSQLLHQQQLQNIQPRPYPQAPLRLRVPSPGSDGSSMPPNSPMPYTPSSTTSAPMQSPIQEASYVNKPHMPSLMTSGNAPYQAYGSVQQPYQMLPLQNPQIAVLQPDQISLPPSTPSEYLSPQPQFHQPQQHGDNSEANTYQSQMQPTSLPPHPPPPPAPGVTNCGVAFSLLNQFMPGKSQSEIEIVTSRICPPNTSVGGGGCCSGGNDNPQSGTPSCSAPGSQNIAGISIPTSSAWDNMASRRNEQQAMTVTTSREKLESCQVDNNTLFEVLDSLG